MTVASGAVPDPAPPFRSLLARTAEVLGWTPGQVWTVLIGLAIAVPAALFGLAPALEDPVSEHQPAAAAVSQAPADGAAAPGVPPSILGGGAGAVTPAASPTIDEPAAPAAVAGPPLSDPVTGTFEEPSIVAVPGPGAVQAIAIAADAVVAAVDTGATEPGRVVVLDATGEVVLDQVLQIGSQIFTQPGGVAVTVDGVFVTTAAPAAVLRVDVQGAAVSKVADLPNVPVCLPLGASSDCQAAVPDTAPRPRHVVITDRGDIYVADSGQGCILRVAPGETRGKTWLCDVSFAALPTASDGGLRGLAWTPGRLVYTTQAGLDGSDQVRQVEIRDRAPGERRDLATVSPSDGATGVIVLPDGRIVVALTTAGALLVVDADGSTLTLPLDGMSLPNDVDVLGDTLLIAHTSDGAAGQVSKRPTSTL